MLGGGRSKVEIHMNELVSTPTRDDLERRFSDFDTLGGALDYAASGARGLNFHDMRGKLARPYPYRELREDALAAARRLMAAGVPIAAVAEADAEVSLTITENRAGWHIAPGDADALERLVRDIATPAGRSEAARRGQNARAALSRGYTLPHVLDQYRALLSDSEGRLER